MCSSLNLNISTYLLLPFPGERWKHFIWEMVDFTSRHQSGLNQFSCGIHLGLNLHVTRLQWALTSGVLNMIGCLRFRILSLHPSISPSSIIMGFEVWNSLHDKIRVGIVKVSSFQCQVRSHDDPRFMSPAVPGNRRGILCHCYWEYWNYLES